MAVVQVFMVCLLALVAAAAPRPESRGLVRFAARAASNETNPGEDRIVGGTAVRQGQLQFVGSLRFLDLTFCDCSIIASNYALTAAHCTSAIPSTRYLTVGAGSNVRELSLYFAADGVFNHPDYDKATLDYDAALVHTSDPIQGQNIAFVQLPVANQAVQDGAQLLVAGFGSIRSGGPASSIMLQTSVNKVPLAQCMQDYANTNTKVTSHMICAAAPGRDACQGDSGGPLVQQTGDLINVQFGIVSFGEGCADPKYPGVYASVANNDIRTFIQQTAKI